MEVIRTSQLSYGQAVRRKAIKPRRNWEVAQFAALTVMGIAMYILAGSL